MADIEKEKIAAPATVAKPVQNLDYVKPDPISSKGLEAKIGSVAEAGEKAAGAIYHLPETLASGTKNLAKAVGRPIVEAGIGAFNLAQQPSSSMRAPKPALTYEDVAQSYKNADLVTPAKKAIAGIFSGSPDQQVLPVFSTQKAAPAQPATPTAGQPLSAPATFIAGGAVDQAAPGVQKPQPKQFETSRVPESQTAVSTEPKAPSFTREQVEGMAEKGQAVSKGSGGNFRYVQGPNGQIIKQNLDTKEVVPMYQGVSGNVLKPGEESPLAKEARERKANAFREALVRQAFQPIDASTNLADVGTIKRNRQMAQQLLSQLDAKQDAEGQLGMEEKKLASTERATAATQEQNRLAKAEDQRIRDRQAAATEKQADIAARAEERKASEKTYLIDGRPVKMTDEQYKQHRTEKDRDKFLKNKTKNEGLSPEEAESEYATVIAAQSQVAKALADPKNADKRDAIIAAYRKATGLDYIE